MTQYFAADPSIARPQIPTGQVKPLISVRDLHKTYGNGNSEFHALRGVSLDINAGESLAIVGKSGSGKSTLMHLLALLDRPTNGSITLDGIETSKLSQKQLNRTRNEKFGFVFQQFFLTAQNSVLDNVTMPLAIAGVSAKERTSRGLEVLRQLEIEDKAYNKANDLSGGQKQRVVIARALINRPSVIFADEPTGNLDSATGGAVAEILFDLNRREGITLVVVTHDEDLAARCDRKLFVRDGLIVPESALGTMPIPDAAALDLTHTPSASLNPYPINDSHLVSNEPLNNLTHGYLEVAA